MRRETYVVRGELHLSLESVAECYQLEVSWVREVYELDLLGTGVRVAGSLAIAAHMLDRVAEIRRLQLQTGMDLLAVSALLRAR